MTGEERSIENQAKEHRTHREECRRKIRSSILLSVAIALAIGLWGVFFSLNLWIAIAVFAVGPLSLWDEIAGFRFHSRKLGELGADDDEGAA